MSDPRARTNTDDPDFPVPEADRFELRPAVDEVPERSSEADEADQLEQAAPLPDASLVGDEDYPHGGRD
jgi:hypothetical protein